MLVAYLLIRFLNRLFTPKKQKQSHSQNSNKYSSNQQKASVEEAKFNIEADTVDYEIIEETKDGNKK